MLGIFLGILAGLLKFLIEFRQHGLEIRNLGLLAAQPVSQAGQSCINSVEKILFVPDSGGVRRQRRIHQLVIAVVVARIDVPSSGSLRELVSQPLHGKLHIRGAEDRIVRAGV